MRIEGSVALVTGSSRGIGAEIARRLSSRGAEVVLHGRTGAAATAALLHAPAVAADLGQPGAAEQLFHSVLAEHGRLDIVVHCAGIGRLANLIDTSADEADRLLEVNLRSPVQLTRLAAEQMSAQGGGAICFIASIAGLLGVAGESVYSASKAGLVGFAESLRIELAPAGVEISLVCPGAVKTEFFAGRGAAYERTWPRPMSPVRVARATVRAIDHNRARTVLPRWLAIAPAVQAALPSVYEPLVRRFG